MKIFGNSTGIPLAALALSALTVPALAQQGLDEPRTVQNGVARLGIGQ